MLARTLAVVLAATAAGADAPATSRLDAAPAEGGIHVHVKKRGLFSAFAHDHDFEVTRWRGSVELPEGDPAHATVELVLAADSLRDREEGLSSGDRKKVEAQAAGPGVLDAAHAPDITYRAERATVEAGGAEGPVRGTLHGALTLRGQTRPVNARFDAAREGAVWRVTGEARFRQSDFGIEPFSGAGGTVGVKDEVAITFTLSLHPSAAAR